MSGLKKSCGFSLEHDLTEEKLWSWLRSRYSQVSALDPYNKLSYEEMSAKLDGLAAEHAELFFKKFVDKN